MSTEMDKSKGTIITGQNPAEKLTLARQMRRQPTPAEAKLWYYLRAGRLNNLHFRRQQVIDGFIADFYCHAAGLVVELDGAIHQAQTEYDTERDHILSERGVRVLRFANTEIEANCPAVLSQIADAAEPSTQPAAMQGDSELPSS